MNGGQEGFALLGKGFRRFISDFVMLGFYWDWWGRFSVHALRVEEELFTDIIVGAHGFGAYNGKFLLFYGFVPRDVKVSMHVTRKS